MSYYTVDDKAKDSAGLFLLASDYGKKILEKPEYDTLWVAVISWEDVRPYYPGNFRGVSKLIKIIC